MTINVYSCGGTGINIGNRVKNENTEVFAIDTSYSNLKATGIPEKNVFVPEGIDGAGKDRSVTNDVFKNQDVLDEILIRFKPSQKLNIVIANLAGGSGSVISAYLTRELVKSNFPVIVVGISSRSSKKELENTSKTLLTFSSFSQMTKKSISMFYIENALCSKVDEDALEFINFMSLITDSENTSGFDTKDLFNFINYDLVTDNSPRLSIIEVNRNTADNPIEKSINVASTILVIKDRDVTLAGPSTEYLSACIITDPAYRTEDLRIDNVLGRLNTIIESLNKQIEDFKNDKRVNKVADVDLSGFDLDGGIIL